MIRSCEEKQRNTRSEENNRAILKNRTKTTTTNIKNENMKSYEKNIR